MKERKDILRRPALALFSVLLFYLSFPGGPVPLLAFAAMAPVAVAAAGAGPRRGFVLFCLFGVLVWLSSVWWLFDTMEKFIQMDYRLAAVFVSAFAFFFAMPYALFGYLAARFRWMDSLYGAVKAAAAFTALTFWFPQIFPGNLTHALYRHPILIQTLDIGGMPLLFFLAHLVNFLLASAVVRYGRDGALPLRHGASILAVFAVITGYGQYRLSEMRRLMASAGPGAGVTIGSIQPDIPARYRGRPLHVPPRDADNGFDTAIRLSGDLIKRRPDVELVAWPEMPVWVSYEDDLKLRQDMAALARSSGRPLVLCNNWRAGGARINGAQLWHYGTYFISKEGEVAGRNVKSRLIPFAEYLPFESGLPWLRTLFPKANRYGPSSEYGVYPLGGDRGIIPLVCYEVIFPDMVRRYVEKGGNIILNPVDDAWFGHSRASETHLALALFRTVEFRVPLVRTANSGISASVQPTGEIVPGSETPLFTTAATAFKLYIPPAPSPYAHWGDVFLYILTALAAADTAVSFFREKGIRR